MRKTLFTAGLAVFAAAAISAQQQPLTVPRPSPNASVSQSIGITEVALHYSRPGVKNRTIWGDLVPYNQVWRTGANENTTISFSTPVKIEGHELPAGLYGLQTIPAPGEWTIIFSKDAQLWGAFDYKQEHDALRFQVKPSPAAPQERMSFEFTDLTDTSAKVVLRWEKLQVPFTVEVDTPKLVADAARSSLRWQNGVQAASYCIQNNTCLDDAGRWLDASIALDANFSNQRAKAQLLAKKNDFKGAVAVGEKALAAGKAAKQQPPPDQLADLEKSVAEWKKK
ncbi:MAG TPA: DUF2911 domain-containing protein [Thermoanaerobaculia bacterium]|jgi:hypothetical protein|nr:DUF2911 domain-containing protein [Thermoanaerobaculia bacterium]